MSSSNIDMVVAIPTFIGSLLSFLATSSAIVLHVVAPPKQHFRHALIMNLLVAGTDRIPLDRWRVRVANSAIDCMNSLNNTISGAVALSSRFNDVPKTVDGACIANAWIGQFSVQTVDFTMLIISIVVLFTVLESRTVPETSTKARVALCVAAWIPGFITSNEPYNPRRRVHSLTTLQAMLASALEYTGMLVAIGVGSDRNFSGFDTP